MAQYWMWDVGKAISFSTAHWRAFAHLWVLTQAKEAFDVLAPHFQTG
jgi:hypothetical protein